MYAPIHINPIYQKPSLLLHLLPLQTTPPHLDTFSLSRTCDSIDEGIWGSTRIAGFSSIAGYHLELVKGLEQQSPVHETQCDPRGVRYQARDVGKWITINAALDVKVDWRREIGRVGPRDQDCADVDSLDGWGSRGRDGGTYNGQGEREGDSRSWP